jgi:hypothetical protein
MRLMLQLRQRLRRRAGTVKVTAAGNSAWAACCMLSRVFATPACARALARARSRAGVAAPRPVKSCQRLRQRKGERERERKRQRQRQW